MRNATCVALIALFACGHKTETPKPAQPAPEPIGAPYDAHDLPLGLDVRLSNGTQGAPAVDKTKLPPAKKLGDVELAALFARMKPFEAAAGDTTSFALRPGSQPPPRTGDVIHDSFPPPASSLLPPAASDTGGELRVTRYMPEGAVKLAPELTITFSQPMVAVTSQTDAASVQPVKLVPQPKGAWRWIGTRTIVFDPDVRFPQATTYRVEIPAGTKSATGGELKHAVAFTFETPTPTLVEREPTDGQPQALDAPIFAMFDQKIDPATVLASVKATVKPKGEPSSSVEVRLLTPAEIAANDELKALSTRATQDHLDGRWLAFRATQRLPADAEIDVTFKSGMASLEGQNKTKAPQSFSFRTYSAFRLEDTQCKTQCPPGSVLMLLFDNPLDEAKYDDQLVTVTPAIPNMHLEARDREVMILGETKARTRYHVKISRKLTDRFAQTLATDLDETFDVGNAQPMFLGPSDMVVLDPAAPKPAIDFFTTNYDELDVKLYQVTPSDYAAYQDFVRNQWNHANPPVPPGRLVLDKAIPTTRGTNQLLETAVDLSPALHDRHGDVVAIIEPSPWNPPTPEPPPRLIVWVQGTKLGIDAHIDGDNLVGYASDLVTGAPLANVPLVLMPGDVTATTNASGIATLPLPNGPLATWSTLVATLGNDHAFVAPRYGTWSQRPHPERIAWYVADDRKMYRPGESVALKGWLRELDPGKGGDLAPLAANVTEVAYRVVDSRNNELLKGTAKVSPLGGFDTTFTLPTTPNLGYTRVELTADGQVYQHALQVEEFRRPEFEVTAHAGAGPYLVAGAGADVTVDAKYYSGGPLAGADVQWTVIANPTSFTPPNHDDYVFGSWRAWWGGDFGNDGDDEAAPNVKRVPNNWHHHSKTDATGEHVLHMDFASVNPAMAMSVTAEASVTDVNRQQWSATTSVVVHPSADYVGVKLKKLFVEQGKPFDLDVIGVDVDGKPVIGAKIDVRSVRLDWEMKQGRYHTKEVDPQSCQVVSAERAQPCQFATKEGGTYRLTATIVDAKGRPSRTELTYWVAGGTARASRDVAQQSVMLIPDKKEYAVGDTAEILVQSPFYPAEGIVTWRRSGIVKLERVSFAGPTTVLKVAIADAMVPNVFVHVDVVGQAPRVDDHGDPDPKLPKRPAYAVGELDLSIPPKTRTLAVTIAPAAPKVAPGESTTLAVAVVDASGRPVANAEVAVIAVDESVLALTHYDLPSPIDELYDQRPSGVVDLFSRSYVKLDGPNQFRGGGAGRGRGYRGHGYDDSPSWGASNGDMLEDEEISGGIAGKDMDRAEGQYRFKAGEKENAPMAARQQAITLAKNAGVLGSTRSDSFASLAMAAPQPIAIRSNFNPLAAFAPTVMTGLDGKAQVQIKLPDNLTRYRLVAIAASGAKDFGKGESTLTARLPLMVRPSAPRFLNFGDTFRLPVTLQNQTDAAMTVRVAVRATNAAITDGAGREVVVPANDRVDVEFPMAAELAGTARFQLVGMAGTATDAAEVSLPVWTPATTEAFATYGVIDAGAIAQPVALPDKVVPQFGGLEITTASTNLQALTDALLYLVHYPFECAEQRASRMVAIASLRDVLTAFHTKDMPTAAALEASVRDDVAHLENMQNSDGGFAFWDRGYPSEPYLSVFVVNALARAKAKGFDIKPELFTNAAPYLANIEQHIPSDYGIEEREAIEAYALATRKLVGDIDIAKAQKLFRDGGGAEKLPIEADGWLLDVFAGNPKAQAERAAIVRYALNHVSETAGAANFTTGYGDGDHLLLASDARVDGVMLEALIQEQKNNDLIPKLVTGLLAHRKAGRWDNTQENAFALIALDLYFRTYEKVTPDFVARVWLGNDYAGDHAFKGHTTETHEIDIAMKDVATHDKAALTIAKDGAGRLYYRVGMKYAPASLKLEPADYGFVVDRHYEAVDDPKDVTRDADGTWHVRAGTRVRIRVSMVNDNRRYQVALVDPMPAGFEPMNAALAVTGSIPTDPGAQKQRDRYWFWESTWYEHQNLRDERAEAFASLLWEGVHEYVYVARATTPGNFVVPPPKAEEMYMPETFGRGASDRVIVE